MTPTNSESGARRLIFCRSESKFGHLHFPRNSFDTMFLTTATPSTRSPQRCCGFLVKSKWNGRRRYSRLPGKEKRQ